MKQQIITVANCKGGTAKTASAGALSEIGAMNGKRVLMIDLDLQANLSIWYRADLNAPGAFELITGRAEPKDTVQSVKKNLSIISGNANLQAVKTDRKGSAERLKNALQAFKRDFDLIVIDTGAIMGELQNNALYASTGLLIPVETDTNSLQALYQITDIAKAIPLKVKGVFITKYDGRSNINKYMRDTIRETCKEIKAPYLGEIRQGVIVRESMAMSTPLFEYAPRSRVALDYQEIYKGACL